MQKLKGIKDPERKRKIIEREFIKILERKEKSTPIKITKITRGKISISFFMIFEFY